MAAQKKKEPQDAAELSLEQAVDRLEAIVVELESGETDLEKSIALFVEGKKLGTTALGKLEALERRIQIITEDGEDGLKLENFEEGGAE